MNTLAMIVGYLWLCLIAIVALLLIGTFLLAWIGGLVGRRMGGPGGEVYEFRRRAAAPPAHPRMRR